MTDSKNKNELTLTEKYKLKGAQQMTYAEYETLRAKNKNAKPKIPPIVKMILGAPFVLIACVGVLFIPYMLYLIITSPSAPPITDEEETTYDSSR